MILTQTMSDLGYPPWLVRGAVILLCEGPTNDGGYGVGGYQGAIDEAVRELYRKYTEHAVVVNAQIKLREGNAHPSYCRAAVTVVGDLYMRQLENVPPPAEAAEPPISKLNKRKRLPCALNELPPTSIRKGY